MHYTTLSATINSDAIKSKCGEYRFTLRRIWNTNLPVRAFLCANPSKADELRYDTTAFKCSNMAVNWGWGGFILLNLYPHYSTNPSGVRHDAEADRLNKEIVSKELQNVDMVVIACGNGHNVKLDDLLEGVPRSKCYCLRRNKGGGFLHPSREKPEDFDTPLLAYSEEILQMNRKIE